MTIEMYETDRPMREFYFRVNGYTHVEAYETETDGGDVIYPMLTCGDGIGSVERNSPCYTLGQLAAWSRRFAPELTPDF